jgi:hypothetical protein
MGVDTMTRESRIRETLEARRLSSFRAFDSYRRRAAELGRMRLRHQARLSTLASAALPADESRDDMVNQELDRQRKEYLTCKAAADCEFAGWQERRRAARPQVAEPYPRNKYEKHPYPLGSLMLVRPDQVCQSPPDDLSCCGSAGNEWRSWQLGWWSLSDDRALLDPPEPGVIFTIVPPPLRVNQDNPAASSECPWLPCYYAADGGISPVLGMGIQGGNGCASYAIAYGIDIGEWGNCGLEFRAESETSGIVDVGGYNPDNIGSPCVQFGQNIMVAQFRCLGLPIAEVPDVWSACPHRIWRAYPQASFENGNPDLTFLTALGIQSVGPFKTEVYVRTRDVQAGDSFFFYYDGDVCAPGSGVQLSVDNHGLWKVKQPVMKTHYYPAQPDYNQMEAPHIPTFKL